MWVLIVDDNAINRATLSRYLSGRGYRVETAERGEAAIAALARRKFDLVLLDVLMPGMSGIEVLRRIRQTTSMSELPIIMITARDGSSDVVEALECGANDYVTKPIDLSVLAARANTQLALKNANEKIRNLALQLEARNKFIRDAFGRYLTDEVVETLLATPEGLELGGESRNATILMSDLRGFSPLSERLSPPQVVSLLNHYLGAMTQVIVRHGGTIDEFIGDAIMVIFGAPVAHADHATRAVACALEMQLSMQAVNEHFARTGLPQIEMGIGINTGEVVVGNIGSDKRAKYGVIGRHVNLAARIEALTLGGQVLISELTREAVLPSLSIERIMEVSLKGANQPMNIFDVQGIGAPYDYSLPRKQSSLVALRQPLAVEIGVFVGVSAPPRLSAARLSHLSIEGAIANLPGVIAPMSSCKLRLPPGGAEQVGEIYGKIIGTAAEGGQRIHFTSMTSEAAQLIARLIKRRQLIGRYMAAKSGDAARKS